MMCLSRVEKVQKTSNTSKNTTTAVKSVGSDSYYHFGIWSKLIDVVAGLDLNLSSCHMQLHINVDGVPL